MKSGKRLRYASIEDMPPALQKLVNAAQTPNTMILKGRRQGMTTAAQFIGIDHGPKGDSHMEVTAEKRDGVVTITGTKEIRRNKYGAVVTYVDGIRFASKREAAYYQQLKYRVSAGEVVYFLRQVPLYMPGGTRLVIDFQEFHTDGSVHYIDVKGRETPAFKIKRREIQHHYPIHVELA